MRTELSGADAVVKLLNSLGETVKEAAMDGLVDVQETIMAESFPEVPKMIGSLEGSAFANDPVITRNKVRITMGYNMVYAVRQHEELEWNHPIKGKAKYLEDPAMRVSPEIPRILKAHLDPEIKKAAKEAGL